MLLTPLLQRCLAEQRPPLPREIQGLALCEGIEERVIEAWLFDRLRQHRPPPMAVHEKSPFSSTLPQSESDAVNTKTNQDIVRLVQEFARRRFFHQCDSTHSRKSAELGGLYKCTFGCGYSTSTRDSWQRHEQLWQPQEFWYCFLCRGQNQKPVICSRKNKILEHFDKCHRDVPREDHNRLRDQSKVHHEPGYERTCKFENSNGICRYRFLSWNDRIEHYLQHFTNKVRDGPWHLRYDRKRWFDDDEDPGKDTWPTGTTTSTTSKSADNSQSTTGSSSSSGGYRTQAANRCDLTLRIGIRDVSSPFGIEKPLEKDGAILPKKLINVATLSWSCASPRSKYVALDSSPSGTFSWPTKAITFFGGLDEYEAQLSELSHTCAPFREACSIVSNMGYDHLWIDSLCESRDDMEHMQALYERAVLTIVLVSSPQNANRISHFSCHYSNIKQVRSWAVESCSVFHVKILGHGAFGIVDEVRLGAAPDLYARKMLLGPKAHRVLKATQFREIEIMQKLRHDNIAEFVAAYVDHRSLNILMRPVAEYSLKDFLAEPSLWPGKLQHIPRWLCSLALAVSYMHGLLLRHKDIKPANILVRGSDVFLSDFGTAFDFSTSDSRSNGAGPMTPKYCAPEVARRAYRGRKADVFSLGCVYLELATVGTGFSLDQLDECLGFCGDGAKNNNVYCKHLGGVSRWTSMLLERPIPIFCRKSIELCVNMMSRNHVARPSAFEVHRVLLSAAIMHPSCAIGSAGSPHYQSLDVKGRRSLSLARPSSKDFLLQKPPRTTLTASRTAAWDVWSLGCLFLECFAWASDSSVEHSSWGVHMRHYPNQKHESAQEQLSTEAKALTANSQDGPLIVLVRQTAAAASKFCKPVSQSTEALPCPWEPYEYDVLAPDQIRLLRLHPGEEDDVVNCTMMTCDKLGAVPYEAVSYSWGSPSPLQRIVLSSARQGSCAQCTVHVRRNLHDALKSLRLRKRSRTLWVDAICINQFDCEERSQQVSKMGEIYHQADKVLVWLGIRSSLSFIAAAETQGKRVTNSEQCLALTASMPGLPSSQWFRRKWIVEEITVANRVVFVSSSHYLEVLHKAAILDFHLLDTESEAKGAPHSTGALQDKTHEQAQDRA